MEIEEIVKNTSKIYLFFKRGFDIVFASLFLVLLSPVFLITAIAVVADTKGPAIFAQKRIGRDRKPFTMFKFRSMCINAEELKKKLAKMNEADGPAFKIKGDPRITRVGHLIRKTSIDELPQLLNIIAGTMSFVGPRPPLPEEVERYRSGDFQRLLVTPGLTCIWQVSGRNTDDFDRWVALDLEYIRKRGFFFDLALFFKTFPAVLKGDGAF
jgi:lipopolysaccharide/colanic/teichoic acid biosynthesis glycosyltransferase